MPRPIDWDDIAAQLRSKSVAELESLEREDYHAFLDPLTEGMPVCAQLSAYELFAALLRATYEGATAARKSA